jgi:hypothetical protein
MPLFSRAAVNLLWLMFPREEKQHCTWQLGQGKLKWCGIWYKMELR